MNHLEIYCGMIGNAPFSVIAFIFLIFFSYAHSFPRIKFHFLSLKSGIFSSSEHIGNRGGKIEWRKKLLPEPMARTVLCGISISWLRMKNLFRVSESREMENIRGFGSDRHQHSVLKGRQKILLSAYWWCADRCDWKKPDEGRECEDVLPSGVLLIPRHPDGSMRL